MAKVLEIREMAEHLRGLKGKVRKATARALLRTANAASNQAKRNARENFKGSRERPKQGFLVNSIFAGFRMSGSGGDRRIAEASVAVRSRKGARGTRPYGRIHEYGGPIEPRKANWLWIPLVGPKSSGERGRFKDLTPRDLVGKLKKQQKTGAGSAIKFRGKRGKGKLFGKKRSFEGEFQISPDSNGRMTAWFIRTIGKGRGIRRKFYALFALRKRVEMPARPYVNPAVAAEFPKFKERLDAELARGKNTPGGGSTPPNQG